MVPLDIARWNEPGNLCSVDFRYRNHHAVDVDEKTTYPASHETDAFAGIIRAVGSHLLSTHPQTLDNARRRRRPQQRHGS